MSSQNMAPAPIWGRVASFRPLMPLVVGAVIVVAVVANVIHRGAGGLVLGAVVVTYGIVHAIESILRFVGRLLIVLGLGPGLRWRERRLYWRIRVIDWRVRAITEYCRGLGSPESSVKGWYGPVGGQWVTALALFCLLMLTSAVKVFLSQTDIQWWTGFCGFYSVAVVFVATVPVLIIWAILSAFHGQPRVRQTLQTLSSCSGMGAAVGFIGVVTGSFLALAFAPVAKSGSIVVALLQGLSVGAIVGYAAGLFVVIIEAAKRLNNRYFAFVASIGLTFMTSAIFTHVADPRHVMDRFLAQVINGTKPVDAQALQRTFEALPTTEAQEAFFKSLDWRSILAAGSSENMFPTPWQFTIGMTLVVTVAAVGSLVQWRRSRKPNQSPWPRSNSEFPDDT